MTRFNKASLMAGTIMAGAVFAVPAYAQDTATDVTATAAEQVEEQQAILVTGSRITRTDLSSTSPVAVVSPEEFRLTGAVNVEQVLNTLPQILPGVTGFSNNPGNGAVTLNLRNLGATRTLVLVNGRRWMFYDTNQIVDLNTIPQFLLGGVEVVTGGASAVYGSDAVAGVVNFKLRDVEGLEVGGSYSLTGRGDAARYQFNAAIGSSFDDGRGAGGIRAGVAQWKTHEPAAERAQLRMVDGHARGNAFRIEPVILHPAVLDHDPLDQLLHLAARDHRVGIVVGQEHERLPADRVAPGCGLAGLE
jgi:outer membrane receptor protein involved in Fe transport